MIAILSVSFYAFQNHGLLEAFIVSKLFAFLELAACSKIHGSSTRPPSHVSRGSHASMSLQISIGTAAGLRCQLQVNSVKLRCHDTISNANNGWFLA